MFKARNHEFPLGKKTYVMGILNYTPDSFSDGGMYFTPEKALDHALMMQAQGADIIDIGANSTRPDAKILSASEEKERLLPVLEAICGNLAAAVSVDTFYPECAEAALKAGADMINDVSGRFNPETAKLAAEYGADCEGEIGCVGGSEDGSEDIAINCTSPAQALEFYEKTGVDALAVAIGNAHGNYKQAPKLRFDILEETASFVKVPLVLHGGTGILSEDFKKCISLGINKINIATATFDSVEQSVRSAYENAGIKGYYDLQSAEVEGAYHNALKHIEIFGCANKA